MPLGGRMSTPAACESTRQAPAGRIVVVILLAVTLLAGGLRVYRLADDNLWCDEGISDLVSRQPSPAAVVQAVIEFDNHPPLYYLLLHSWRGVFGSSDFTLRLLSALLGTAAIPVLFLAARVLFDDAAGLVAASLLALSPIAVYYSQEARMYALLMLLCAALLAFAVRLVTKGDATSIIGLILVSMLLPNVHFYGGPLVACALLMAAWSLWRRPELRSRLRWVALTALATGIGLVPWAFAVAQRQLAFASALPHFVTPSLESIASVFARFMTPAGVVDAGGVMALLAVTVAAVLLVAIARRGDRSAGSSGPSREAVVWSLAFVLVPVVLIAAIGYFAPFWVLDRVAVVMAVPLALLLGAAVSATWRHGRRWQAGLLGALMVAMCTAGFWQIHATPTRPDWESLVRHMEAHERPDDAVMLVHDHWTEPLFDRYYGGNLPRTGVDRAIHGRDLLRAIIDEVRVPGGRVWLVMYHERESPLAEVLGEVMRRGEEENFRGPILMLFEPQPHAPAADP